MTVQEFIEGHRHYFPAMFTRMTGDGVPHTMQIHGLLRVPYDDVFSNNIFAPKAVYIGEAVVLFSRSGNNVRMIPQKKFLAQFGDCEIVDEDPLKKVVNE